MLILSLLFAAPAEAAAPASFVLPSAVYRPSGRGEGWVGGYYMPTLDADGFGLGPAGPAFGVDAGTSDVCAAGMMAMGAPQGAIDDWTWLGTAYGRCSPVQLEDNVFNLGGYVFAGFAGDVTGNWTGAGILGVAAEGGIENLRLDASVPVVPIVFRDPWFEADLYKSFEAGLTGVYEGHYLRIGIANLAPVLTYKLDIEGYGFAVSGTLWQGQPGIQGRIGYQF
ncbi:MAG: hypothetical protein EP330_02145 [Deltaproteobacteria bacterium]|nr:MAG: hypothetical protein EP330_02145 [Deltaproteobacteria bacterium]